MRHLKFLVPVQNYRVNDIATFDNDKIADGLINGRYCEEIELESTKIEPNKKK